MEASWKMQTIIDTLSDPILILGPSKGSVIAYNRAFVDEWGFAEETFKGKPFLKMPQFSRAILRGLIDIYARARKGSEERNPYIFYYPDNKGTLKTLSATATPIEEDCSGRSPCVMIRFQVLSQLNATNLRAQEASVAFDIFTDITDEPWLEFRPPVPILAPTLEDNDRRGRLFHIGKRLHLTRASKAAIHLYGLSEKDTASPQSGFKLKDKTFPSFFFKEEDAHRMLDILTTIGFIKARATLLDGRDNPIETEVSCAAQFGHNNSITAIYCIFHFSENLIECRRVMREWQLTRDFAFNQPFLGFGVLMPKRPLKRPDAASVENALVEPLLDSMLDSIVLMTVNEAMIKFRGAAKSQLLMQPMSALFPDRTQAIHVLRELFVTRESSYAHYNEENRLHHISIFKAIFNDADEMTRIFVSTSPQTQGVKERYNNLPLDFEGDAEAAEPQATEEENLSQAEGVAEVSEPQATEEESVSQAEGAEVSEPQATEEESVSQAEGAAEVSEPHATEKESVSQAEGVAEVSEPQATEKESVISQAEGAAEGSEPEKNKAESQENKAVKKPKKRFGFFKKGN